MSFVIRLFLISLTSVFIFTFTPALQAAEKQSITIQDPFARASIGKVSAVFMTIHNNQKQEDRLLKAETSLGGVAELHNHIMEDGVMKMRAVNNITIPAESSVTLYPGGLHIMLFNLPKPLKAGKTFQMTLIFEKAGPINFEVPVQPMGKTIP